MPAAFALWECDLRAVMETPCGGSDRVVTLGIFRLRLYFAFAKHNLRSR